MNGWRSETLPNVGLNFTERRVSSVSVQERRLETWGPILGAGTGVAGVLASVLFAALAFSASAVLALVIFALVALFSLDALRVARRRIANAPLIEHELTLDSYMDGGAFVLRYEPLRRFKPWTFYDGQRTLDSYEEFPQALIERFCADLLTPIDPWTAVLFAAELREKLETYAETAK